VNSDDVYFAEDAAQLDYIYIFDYFIYIYKSYAEEFVVTVSSSQLDTESSSS